MSRRRSRLTDGLPFLVLPLLASCVAPAPVASPPPPPPSITAPPPPVAAGHDWTDGPIAPGRWRYRAEGAATVAAFGTTAAAAPAFTLACTGGEVVAERPGAVGTLRITTSFGVRSVALPARFAPSDPLLDQLAFSRGRLMIEAAPLPPLVIPAQAEIGRVVEDCRG